MAKASKTKKVKPEIGQPSIDEQLKNLPMQDEKEEETTSEEIHKETLETVPEVVGENVITEVTPEPKEVVAEVKSEVIEAAAKSEPAPIKITPATEQTEEEKILSYISNSHASQVELNPLLKSLYPMPNFKEPAQFLQKSESKRIKTLIEKLLKEEKILLSNESYKLLGSFYYADGDPKTKHHTLETIKIVAKKL